MEASHYKTIERLGNILRELECEFLYLIGDMQVDNGLTGTYGQDIPVQSLELARHCLAAAAEALDQREPAEMV